MARVLRFSTNRDMHMAGRNIQVRAILQRRGLRRAKQRARAELKSQFFAFYIRGVTISVECTAHRFMDGLTHFLAKDQAKTFKAIAALIRKPGDAVSVQEDLFSNEVALVTRRQGGAKEISLMLSR